MDYLVVTQSLHFELKIIVFVGILYIIIINYFAVNWLLKFVKIIMAVIEKLVLNYFKYRLDL